MGGFTAAVMSACQPDHGRHHHRRAVLVGGPVLGDRVDFGIAFDVAEYGMADGRLAKLARHRHVLRVIEMLPPKEDDLPLQERLPHLFQLVRRQGLGEVHTADFRTDVKGEGCYIDGPLRFAPAVC